MEALSKAGTFDCIHKNRKQIHDSCEVLSKYCMSFQEEKQSSQMSLFGDLIGSSNTKPILAKTDDWVSMEKFRIPIQKS